MRQKRKKQGCSRAVDVTFHVFYKIMNSRLVTIHRKSTQKAREATSINNNAN